MPKPLSYDDLIRAKLPVWRTVKNAFVLTFGNLGTFLKLAGPLLLLVLAVNALQYWLMYPVTHEIYSRLPEPAPVSMKGVMVPVMLASVVSYCLLSAAAVGWHRFLLRHEEAQGMARFDGRSLRYAVTAAAMFFVMQLPSTLQTFATPVPGESGHAWQVPVIIVLSLASLVVLLYFYRIFVILPGIAVDNPDASVAGVMRATRGHTLRLFAGNILASAPFTLVFMVIYYFLVLQDDRLTSALLTSAASLIMYAGMAASLAFTSLAYRHFYELTAPGEV
jgi:hypothetical protein